jgi:hypothetical protein
VLAETGRFLMLEKDWERDSAERSTRIATKLRRIDMEKEALMM